MAVNHRAYLCITFVLFVLLLFRIYLDFPIWNVDKADFGVLLQHTPLLSCRAQDKVKKAVILPSL